MTWREGEQITEFTRRYCGDSTSLSELFLKALKDWEKADLAHGLTSLTNLTDWHDWLPSYFFVFLTYFFIFSVYFFILWAGIEVGGFINFGLEVYEGLNSVMVFVGRARWGYLIPKTREAFCLEFFEIITFLEHGLGQWGGKALIFSFKMGSTMMAIFQRKG